MIILVISMHLIDCIPEDRDPVRDWHRRSHGQRRAGFAGCDGACGRRSNVTTNERRLAKSDRRGLVARGWPGDGGTSLGTVFSSI